MGRMEAQDVSTKTAVLEGAGGGGGGGHSHISFPVWVCVGGQQYLANKYKKYIYIYKNMFIYLFIYLFVLYTHVCIHALKMWYT